MLTLWKGSTFILGVHHVSFDKSVSKIRLETENLIRLQGKDKVLLLLQSDVPINQTHIKELVGNVTKCKQEV